MNKTLDRCSAILLISISMLAISLCFLFTESFAFLDNEELFLVSKVKGTLIDTLMKTWPYSTISIMNAWVCVHLFPDVGLIKLRLLSIFLGAACYVVVTYISFKILRNLWLSVVMATLLILSNELQTYIHRGVPTYIGAILLSVGIYYFYYCIKDANTSDYWKTCLVIVGFSTLYILVHPDLIIEFFVLSALVGISWGRLLYGKVSVVTALFILVRRMLPFLIPMSALILFFTAMPNSAKDVGIRSHQHNLFYATSQYYDTSLGMLSFFWNAANELFRRSTFIVALNGFWGELYLYILKFFFVSGLILPLIFKKRDYFESRALNFSNAFIGLVFLTTAILNLLEIHQIGQPRYSLYLIFPIYLSIFLSFSLWLKLASSVVRADFTRLTIPVFLLCIFASFLFIYKNEASRRMVNLEKNNEISSLLNGNYQLIIVDDKYQTLFREVRSDETVVFRAGTSAPQRIKNKPSEDVKLILEKASSVLAVTAFVPITQHHDGKSWGYEGFDQLAQHYCKSKSITGGRILVEVWDKCKTQQ